MPRRPPASSPAKPPASARGGLSAINLDPRVRGYNSGQLNATRQRHERGEDPLDIDSALSQIDPGVVNDMTVIDGPYTSLYGPGFAFMAADLLSAPRYANGPGGPQRNVFHIGSNAPDLLHPRKRAGWAARIGGCASVTGSARATTILPAAATPSASPPRTRNGTTCSRSARTCRPLSRIEFDYVRSEMNGVKLPGVVYDLDNSTNNQFNLRYIVQEDPKGPKQFVLQAWYQQTAYRGDASTAVETGVLLPVLHPARLDARRACRSTRSGRASRSRLGTRLLWTFGDRDSAAMDLWRRLAAERAGVPRRESRRQRHARPQRRRRVRHSPIAGRRLRPADRPPLALVGRGFLDLGGRLDYCHAALDAQDPVVTQYNSPADYANNYYYTPGFDDPHALLGMAYLTAKVKLSAGDHAQRRRGFRHAACPTWPSSTATIRSCPIARFGNSYVSGFSQLSPEKDLQFDLGFTTKQKTVSYGARGFCA